MTANPQGPVRVVPDEMTAGERAFTAWAGSSKADATPLMWTWDEMPQSQRDRWEAIALAAAPSPAAPEGVEGWRTDFEKAPKDRSILVGYDEVAGRRLGENDRVYEARWNEVQQTWASRNGFILYSDATAWRPLPAPPVPLADGGR